MNGGIEMLLENRRKKKKIVSLKGSNWLGIVL
jgi:hypothetical protein